MFYLLHTAKLNLQQKNIMYNFNLNVSIRIISLSLITCIYCHAQSPEKARIEAEYLTKAKSNIEKYRKGNAVFTFKDSSGMPIKNLKVEVSQVSQDFLFGALLFDLVDFKNKNQVNKSTYQSLFKEVFNFGVLPFYWNSYEGEQGKPKWQHMNETIEWSKQNGITLKGHPLAWTHIAGMPRWLKGMPLEMSRDLLKARIYNNVAGHKEDIKIWDVVNEPVTTLPWELALKDTSWNENARYQVKEITQDQITPWVYDAFHWADQANPSDGHFILNEFYQIAKPSVREKFYNLVKELQAKKMPLHGIGIQAHEPHEMWFSPIEVYKTLDLYQEFNLPIHITEFIPQSSGKSILGWREGEVWTEKAQADFAEQFYTLVFSHPKVVSINWWSFSDASSWLKGGGIVDKDLNPKPVYNTLKKLIKQDWLTQLMQLSTDQNGEIKFRGFGGKYELKITTSENKLVSKFSAHLKENSDNSASFTVEEK
jgi:endo-1,4-beta-xylanase